MYKSEKSTTFALVIELDRHIEILLLSNDCVIVPGLGGFMAHHVDARYEDEESLFLPPLRTIGFNPQLTMNDSLLAQSYVEAYDMSYPEALRRIEREVIELKQHMDNDGYYELYDIGVLRLNEEGHYEFEPCEAGILTPSLYGLSSFEMPLTGERKHLSTELSRPAAFASSKKAQGAEGEDVDANSQFDEETEEANEERIIAIKMSWIRNTAAIAAAILCFFLLTPPISNSQIQYETQQSAIFTPKAKPAAGQQPQKPAADEPKVAATTAAEKPAVEPKEEPKAEQKTEAATVAEAKPATQEVKAEKQKADEYVLVLASQTSKRHAEDYVEYMQKKGFDKARMYVNKKMVRVIYGSYASEAEAYTELISLRKNSKEFKDTWIYKLKND